MILTLELILVGTVTGVLSGLLGVGGGFLFVPLLTLIDVPMRAAAGLSLLYVACIAASGGASHWRQGTADVKVAAAAAPGGVLVVPLGSYCSGLLSDGLLQVIFGLLVLAAAGGLYWQAMQRNPFPGVPVVGSGTQRPSWVVIRRARVRDTEYLFPVSLLRGLMVGAVTGFFSGLVGVGGGPILVALLVLVVGVPVPIAMGTSHLTLVAPALVGAVTHYVLGHIDLMSALPAVIAGVLGAALGARGTLMVSAHRLRYLMIGLLMAVAVYMVGRGLL